MLSDEAEEEKLDNDGRKAFTVRMERDLYNQLVMRAKKNKRNTTNELLVLIERFINSKEVSKDSATEPASDVLGNAESVG